MHNLNYQQIVILGAAIVFGIPAASGIVVGYFGGIGRGIFTGLVVFGLIVRISSAKLKAMAKEQKGKGEGDNDRHNTETH